MGTPTLANRDLGVGTPTLVKANRDLGVGTPTLANRDLGVGTPTLVKANRDLGVGTPTLANRDLGVGTPTLVKANRDLGVGKPTLVKALMMGTSLTPVFFLGEESLIYMYAQVDTQLAVVVLERREFKYDLSIIIERFKT